MSGTSHLVSANESNLRGTPVDVAPNQATIEDGGILGGSLIRWFLIVILVVLMVESWLFHRHAVY